MGWLPRVRVHTITHQRLLTTTQPVSGTALLPLSSWPTELTGRGRERGRQADRHIGSINSGQASTWSPALGSETAEPARDLLCQGNGEVRPLSVVAKHTEYLVLGVPKALEGQGSTEKLAWGHLET